MRISDWSSDVCSSDLGGAGPSLRGRSRPIGAGIEATLGPGIACQGNPITGTRSSAIARPPFDSTPSRDGPRVNEMITSPQVRLVDENGEQVGVVSTADARRRAESAGLDLMEVSTNAVPQVRTIRHYGRFRSKRADEGQVGKVRGS